MLHTDDLVLMSESSEFKKLYEAFESKCLKVKLGKTKVIIRGCI